MNYDGNRLFVILLILSSGQVVYAHKFVDLTGENLTDSSLFDEHLCSLLCDLTGLAMGKYSKVGGSFHLTRCSSGISELCF